MYYRVGAVVSHIQRIGCQSEKSVRLSNKYDTIWSISQDTLSSKQMVEYLLKTRYYVHGRMNEWMDGPLFPRHDISSK